MQVLTFMSSIPGQAPIGYYASDTCNGCVQSFITEMASRATQSDCPENLGRLYTVSNYNDTFDDYLVGLLYYDIFKIMVIDTATGSITHFDGIIEKPTFLKWVADVD